jgi:DNA-binding CsgD family transcriptional regulator
LVALFNGRWDDACRELHAVLSIAAETGAEAHVLTAHAGLAAVAFGRDDLETARSHLSAGHEAMRSGLHLFGVDLLLWLTATDGFRARGAAATFPALWELWTRTSTMRGLTQFRSIAPDVVKAAVAAERLDAAEAVVTEVESLADRSSTPSLLASARRCRSLLDGRPEALMSAADLVGASPWRMDYVWACRDAAEVLAEAGADDQASELTENATRELAEMRSGGRADPDMTSTQVGAVRGSLWDAVSPREREVVQLLAAGAGNPEIARRLYISRRTVESHVASVMRKLGAINRTQIAIIAAQRGIAR